MSRLTLVLFSALTLARVSTYGDVVRLGVVFKDEPFSLDLRVGNTTKTDVEVAKAIPSCDCVSPLFAPTKVAAGSGTTLPFQYLSHGTGSVNVVVEFQTATGQTIQRSTIHGYVADRKWLISPQDLHGTTAKEVVIVDVRASNRFAEAHLARSINILPFALKTRLDIKKSKLVLVDDGVAPDTLLAYVRTLGESGFSDVVVLSGGIAAWVRAGFPIEGTDPLPVRVASVSAADFARASATTEWRVVEVGDNRSVEGSAAVTDWKDIPNQIVWSSQGANDSLRPTLVMAADPAIYGRIENALSKVPGARVYYLTGGRAELEAYRRTETAVATADHQLHQSTPPSKSHPAVTGGGCSACGK